jgi:hypothetical protein
VPEFPTIELLFSCGMSVCSPTSQLPIGLPSGLPLEEPRRHGPAGLNRPSRGHSSPRTLCCSDHASGKSVRRDRRAAVS